MTQIAFKKALVNIIDDFFQKKLDFSQTYILTQQNLKQKISNQVDTYIFKAIQQKLFPKGYTNYELFSFAVTVVLLLEYYEHYQVTGQVVNIQHFYKPLLQRQNSKLAFQALAQLIHNKDFDLFLTCYNVYDIQASKQNIYEYVQKMPIRKEIKTINQQQNQMFFKEGTTSEICNLSPVPANQSEYGDISIQFQAQSYETFDAFQDMDEDLFDNFIESSMLDTMFFTQFDGEDKDNVVQEEEQISETKERKDQKAQKQNIQADHIFDFGICIKKYIRESPKIIHDQLSSQQQSSMLSKIINRKNDVNPLFKNKKKGGR